LLLWGGNKIAVSLKGVTWIENSNGNLRKAIERKDKK